VHGPAGEEGLRHAADGVWLAPGEGELVVGLLVRTGFPDVPMFTPSGPWYILPAQRKEGVRGVVIGAPRADDDGVEAVSGRSSPATV
jgi:hypothetical protein